MSLHDHHLPTGTPTMNWVPALSPGDAYVAAAAVAYTFHCIRLEKYAKSTSAVKLAATKASVETILSASAAASLILISRAESTTVVHSDTTDSFLSPIVEAGREIVEYTQSLSIGIMDGSMSFPLLLPVILAIFWTGWITCAYTIYAQSYGQSRVRPVTANLIYTIQPVCTAIFAWLLLGETLQPAGYAGGGLIAAAVLIVATEDDG
jgi:hypothetical protein